MVPLTMKMELVVGLLIYLVTVTLANVVPAVDQKVTVGAVAIELVDSAESIESLGNNDPKVSIVDVTKESVSPTKSIESVETTEPIESAKSTESSVDNDVLKTSETFHRRYYHYPRTYYYYPRYHYPQYYRQPVAFGYYNRYQPQQPHNANHYSYNRPSSSPVYYTQSTTSSPVHYTKSTTSSPVYYTQSTTPDSDDVPYDFSAY